DDAAAVLHLPGGVFLLGHQLCRCPHRCPARHPRRHSALPVRLCRQAGPLQMSVRTSSRPVVALTTLGAWLLAVIWVAPLLYSFWTAFHPPAYAARFGLLAPWTLDNFARVWEAAPFARYF